MSLNRCYQRFLQTKPRNYDLLCSNVRLHVNRVLQQCRATGRPTPDPTDVHLYIWKSRPWFDPKRSDFQTYVDRLIDRQINEYKQEPQHI